MQTPVAIPAEAPVMVLPGTVLLPDGMLPLRIFEPRYRAMLEWALEHDRMFCIALMKPGVSDAITEDQFFHTAGIGLITASVTQPDDTSQLMLHGLAGVRFTGFAQRQPFRIARIEAVEQILGEPAEAAVLAEEVRAACSLIRVNGSALPEEFTEMLGEISGPDSLANAVAHSLIGTAADRQGLLEEPDATARLRIILRLLAARFPVG